ncbi:hypothetical protein [Streptomyces sp. NPDC050145]|uniref:hypothetical protein n=1 Tax=Streptomyces sp. NPDC050145 TaxID=3365602 RepID=UPI0037B0E3AC
MGSLRNPIGPLPSSIYWRRRVVLVSLVALLALLGVWVVNFGGGTGNKGAGGTDGKHPTESITPGPSGTGPAISQHPGGRDESGSGSGGAGDGGAGDGGSSDGGSGDGSDSGGSGGSSDGAGSGSGGGGATSGDRVPAGSSLPDCTAGSVTLSVRSVRNSYGPDDKPELVVTVKSTADKACKVDLGPRTAVLTITKADDDKKTFWSSEDCPAGAGTLLLRVPAGGKVSHTVNWDKRPSAPQCATPSAGSATPGTYLVEVKGAQLSGDQTSFVLKAD